MVLHAVLIVAVIAIGIYAHIDFKNTHNPKDVVIEEVAEDILKLEGVPIDFEAPDEESKNDKI